MAVRPMLRRISSALFQDQRHSPFLLKDPWLQQFTPSITSSFFNLNSHTKAIQTTAPQNPNQDSASEEEKKPDTSLELHGGTTDSCSLKNSNLKSSSRHDLAMVFTCKVCETRSVKTACRESYEKGVVVVRCEGCNNLHLIADRLGWFGQPGSVEDFLAARGEEVKKGSADTLNLTLEDLAGTKSNGFHGGAFAKDDVSIFMRCSELQDPVYSENLLEASTPKCEITGSSETFPVPSHIVEFHPSFPIS